MLSYRSKQSTHPADLSLLLASVAPLDGSPALRLLLCPQPSIQDLVGAPLLPNFPNPPARAEGCVKFSAAALSWCDVK